MEMEEPNKPAEGRPEAATGHLAAEFFKEVAVFLSGLLLGFFWYMYYSEKPDADTHIIIGLLVIIICMTRYVTMLKRRAKD